MKFGSRNNDTGKINHLISELIIFLFFILQFSFLVFNCRDKPTPPPDYQPSIFLSAEDVGVTDAWIKLRAESIEQREWNIELRRDGQTIITLSSSLNALCSPLDTLILDEGLLPNRTYTYKAYLQYSNTPFDSSTPLFITTMDTTSHNFTWQIDTLGDGSSSELRDVAIINDTCVWAVGEINCKDSLGNWMPMYNAARWDGNKWNKLRIPFIMNYGTSVFIDSTIPISSVYTPISNDIWFCNGAVTRLVNNSWMKMNFLLSEGPGRANKIWGTSSDNMYFVADLGRITHWNGSSASGGWRRLESGTSLPIQDIWGSKNKVSGEWEILAIASNKYLNEGKKLLKIENYLVTSITDSGLPWSLSGIWFESMRNYYVIGDGMFIKKYGKNKYIWQGFHSGLTQYYPNAIRGSGINNIAVAGAFGVLIHYNGYSWKNYTGSELLEFAGSFLAVDIKGKLLVAVGRIGDRSLVLRGKQN